MALSVKRFCRRNVSDKEIDLRQEFYTHIIKNNPFRYPKNEVELAKLTSAFLTCKKLIMMKHDHFCIPNSNSEKVLMVKTQEQRKFLKMILLENVYDIIEEAHLNSGHGTVCSTNLLLRKQYLIPYEWVSYYVYNCYLCRFNLIEKPDSIPLFGAELCIRAVLDAPADNNFKHVLVYVDQNTHYSIIRPLMMVTENEVALELLKMFADFSPPQKIGVSVIENINFNSIIEILQNIKLPFKLPVIYSNKYTDVLALTTLNMLLTGISLMNKVEKKNWAVGIGALQWKINLSGQGGFESRFAEKSTLKSRYHAHFGVHPNKTTSESDSKVRTCIVVCSECNYPVLKKFFCCKCKKPFHFTCCLREVVKENKFQSKMLTTCFPCASKDHIILPH